jgi:L-lysine 2,3-aminomutase
LHMLDKVTGAQHFEVSRQNALQLSDDIRQKLPGFLVPKLVEEIAGAHSKTPVYPLI